MRRGYQIKLIVFLVGTTCSKRHTSVLLLHERRGQPCHLFQIHCYLDWYEEGGGAKEKTKGEREDRERVASESFEGGRVSRERRTDGQARVLNINHRGEGSFVQQHQHTH